DVSEENARKAHAKIGQLLSRQVEKGRITAEEREAILGRITPAGTLDVARGLDMAVEAVTENEELKKDIFRKLDELIRPEGILASNTSSISITRMAAATRRPERFIGMHFMNPVPVMKLVEIIRGAQTSDETYAETKALAEKMGKVTVLSRDFPGFSVNRTLIPILSEACYAVQAGLAAGEGTGTAMT